VKLGIKVSLRKPQAAVIPITPKLNIKNNIKRINLAIFFLPTQLFIQVQWWSYCSMHTLHISQW